MAEITYYFNAKGTDVWSNAAYIIDNLLTNYAYTSVAGAIQLVNGNTCPGTNLGDITKVELRVYAYGDADDRIDLTPVFGGSNDGDEHQTTPGVSPGSWGFFQDITRDTNAPGVYEKNLVLTVGGAIYGSTWGAQTFTPGTAHSVDFIDLNINKTNSPGDFTVSIKATDGSGHPTGADLVSCTIEEADIPSSHQWVRCFVTPYALSQGTKYAIVFRAPNGNVTNTVSVYYTDSDVYANGNKEHSIDSGSNWSGNTSFDFSFAEGVCFGFSAIQNIDCKVKKNSVAKGNMMYCAKVEIKVTYTPSAGTTRSHGYIFG